MFGPWTPKMILIKTHSSSQTSQATSPNDGVGNATAQQYCLHVFVFFGIEPTIIGSFKLDFDINNNHGNLFHSILAAPSWMTSHAVID